MKKRKTITKLVATAAMAVVAVSSGFAQTSSDEGCGCPAVASRTVTVNLSSLAVSGGANDGDLIASNTILTCDKMWLLDKKIFVPAGKTITIQPGTVVKGKLMGTPASEVALIVERGGKIFASGDENCQIIFTAEADPVDGTYPVSNTGKWGGLVIAGRATNNLTLAANGPYAPGAGDGKLAFANGLGGFEGFATADTRMQFGADLTAGETFDDNDNSGILRFVSIRHAGAILAVGGEINGISLGSVGRGTTMDHIEVISSADDGMEFWGGTVNISHYVSMFGNDDMFDWDDGYSGKAQFVFGIKGADNTSSTASDNGFECDADDQKSNLLPRSHPVIYNATVIGNPKTFANAVSDESGPAAIMAKELTEGEFYNSVFSNFQYGLEIKKAIAAPRTSQVYDNWIAGSFKVICNAFINCTNPLTMDKAAPLASDLTKFNTTDMNQTLASAPGFVFAWAMNPATNVTTTPFDASPSPALSVSGCPAIPVDGFFDTRATYKGAFAPSGESWLSDWSFAAYKAFMAGLSECPTDINQDGSTTNSDLSQLLLQFGKACK